LVNVSVGLHSRSEEGSIALVFGGNRVEEILFALSHHTLSSQQERPDEAGGEVTVEPRPTSVAKEAIETTPDRRSQRLVVVVVVVVVVDDHLLFTTYVMAHGIITATTLFYRQRAVS
jgi:hypothetical protein